MNKKEFEVRFGYFEKRKLHDNMKPLRRRNIHAQLRRNSENEFNIDEWKAQINWKFIDKYIEKKTTKMKHRKRWKFKNDILVDS